jgi:redox-sensitive bicupin YhaK (pirin superfamily)
VRAGPGAAVRANLAARAEQFWYVLSGGVLAEASKLGTGACIFVSGDQEPFELSAAAEGVELVLLQFSPA